MLELVDISKTYGNKPALTGVSLELREGIYALLGPNGAGKSTLINIITGNLRPTGGKVLWEGEDIAALGPKYRAVLGFAPQIGGMYSAFTGRRFLSYMATLKGISRRDQPAEIERVLSAVNMAGFAARPVGSYSGGMRQRLLLAQALLGDPKLLVLDEPTAGLDPMERVRIREGLHRLAPGRTILVSTHVVSDIETIADEVILLRGRVLDRGTVEELRRREVAGSLEDVYMGLFGEEGQDGEPRDI